jgi:CO/xanthine dehydrogenase Mo-binding subunit
VATDVLDQPKDELELREGRVEAKNGDCVSFGEVFKAKFGMQAGNIVGVGSFKGSYQPPDHKTGQSPQITPFWMVGATGAEVEVDTETGRVSVTRLVNVADVGTALNPSVVARQLSGAAIMQLGFTMSEEMFYIDGQLINASLADYKIPGFFDVPPDISNHVIEMPHREGPFGAKGVGESGTFAVSPAIANAIEDAVGVRVYDSPLTPENVFSALRAAGGRRSDPEGSGGKE